LIKKNLGRRQVREDGRRGEGGRRRKRDQIGGRGIQSPGGVKLNREGENVLEKNWVGGGVLRTVALAHEEKGKNGAK